ncbi:MAG: hypothetical protein QXT64_02485 [Desulfurococcaceae archaeon]
MIAQFDQRRERTIAGRAIVLVDLDVLDYKPNIALLAEPWWIS